MAIASYLCRRNLLNRLLTYKHTTVVVRSIHTSKKKGEDEEAIKLTPEIMRPPIPDFSKPNQNKNWISYGYSYTDRAADIQKAHLIFFCNVTLMLVCTVFYYWYLPDPNMDDWIQREAFIKLRERELAGLPPIDKDYIPADRIVLPSDEELGDTPIII